MSAAPLLKEWTSTSSYSCFPVDRFECRRWHSFCSLCSYLPSLLALITLPWSNFSIQQVLLLLLLPSWPLPPFAELVFLHTDYTLFIFLFFSKMVIKQCYAVFYAFLTSKKIQFICICLKHDLTCLPLCHPVRHDRKRSEANPSSYCSLFLFAFTNMCSFPDW